MTDKEKKAAYLRKWRADNEDKARAIQARYYYANRDKILEEHGFRLEETNPRSRGAYDPLPLRRKRIQIETIRSGPFRGLSTFVFDFNESLFSSSLFKTVNPKKISFPNNMSANPNRPLIDFSADETLFRVVSSFLGSSSSTKCGIDLIVR